MENDYNPQNATVLFERKTRLRMRSKGDWPGSAKVATGGAEAYAGSVLGGWVCVVSRARFFLWRRELIPRR